MGKRVTLYCDETVRFGNDVTGGTRISHMSGIGKKLSVPLIVKRGKSAMYTVEPLPDIAPAVDWLTELANAGSNVSALNKLGHAAKNAGAGEDVLGQIRAAMNAAKEQEASA
ncbi:hypothetical protein DEI98_06415 [Curtobacterium sp. MCLR17_034]|nr:hypothetical protein DEI98_06415 [Curtobacterium sp. MCLR17_034]